jgi:hypothetical protein
MYVCCECCVLSGRGLCEELITCPEKSYRLWCVVVCDLEKRTSWMRRPRPTSTYLHIPTRGLSRQEKKIMVILRTYSMWCTINMIALYDKRMGMTNISWPWPLESRAIRHLRKVIDHLWPAGTISVSENISYIVCRLEPYATRSTISKWKQGQSVWSFKMGAGDKSAAEE